MMSRRRSSFSVVLLCGLALFVGAGWFKRSPPAPPNADDEAAADPVVQQMDGFTMAGYASDGTKKWALEGSGADIEGTVVTISRPDGIGYDVSELSAPTPATAPSGPSRTAYLTASIAQMEQESRRVRMEHDVIIHTSDGLWLSSPLLYWLPDRDELTTEQSVRLETDHMLLRARGATGHATLKEAVFLRDIELVLNPTSEESLIAAPGEEASGPPARLELAPGRARRHVMITCDGPLTFDYTRYIATFEQNVHVKDGDSDLYSDTLVAYLDKQTRTIRYAEARGRVRITQGPHTALGNKAVYEPRDSRMTLLGSPSLTVYPDEHTPAPTIGGAGVKPLAQGPQD